MHCHHILQQGSLARVQRKSSLLRNPPSRCNVKLAKNGQTIDKAPIFYRPNPLLGKGSQNAHYYSISFCLDGISLCLLWRNLAVPFKLVRGGFKLWWSCGRWCGNQGEDRERTEGKHLVIDHTPLCSFYISTLNIKQCSAEMITEQCGAMNNDTFWRCIVSH